MNNLKKMAVASLTLLFVGCIACTKKEVKPIEKPAIPTANPIIIPQKVVDKDNGAVIPPDAPSKCPSGMTEISGEYCTDLKEECLKWGDPHNSGVNGRVQCLEFKYPSTCVGKTIHMDYCIDTIPYPYDLNAKPATNMTWYSAKKICENQGKELCNIKEFRQACRGPENNPYPTGYSRRCDLCNCDRTPWLDPKTHTFEQLDKRVPIKDILECKSGYGVSGLVGNTDHWVVNETGKPFCSGLVGGHPILGARNRCGGGNFEGYAKYSSETAITWAHGPNSQYYEFGQPLCCKEAN